MTCIKDNVNVVITLHFNKGEASLSFPYFYAVQFNIWMFMIFFPFISQMMQNSVNLVIPNNPQIWYHVKCYNRMGSIAVNGLLVVKVGFHFYTRPGPWFNIKMSSYQYRRSHCEDKTAVRSSYLHNGISYPGKIASLYWFSPQYLKV